MDGHIDIITDVFQNLIWVDIIFSMMSRDGVFKGNTKACDTTQNLRRHMESWDVV